MRAWANKADIKVASEADWASLIQRGIDTIVDPMILRAAELFLAGRSAQRGEADWSGISANLQELVHFFDLLVYQDQIPMIDYGYTFQPSEGFEVGRLYDVCNQTKSGAMVAVAIEGTAYETARAQALKALEVHGPVNPSLRDSIAAEMTSFDYQWRPDLGPALEAHLGPSETPERRAITFLYGGILFGVYAKRIGGAHLLPSKRARLDAAAAINAPTARFEDESAVFDRLDSIAAQLPEFKQEPVKLSAIPPVLPYLLGRYQPKSAYELVFRALELRGEDDVSALIKARKELVAAWRDNAEIPDGIVRDLRRVGAMLGDRLTPYTPPDATAGLTAYFLKAVPIHRLWNWALSNVPGKNHIKLLFRLHKAAQPRARTGDLYSSLEHSLLRLWQSS